MRGGTVRPRGPITAEEFGKLPITDLAAKLRNEWTPKKLYDQNTSDDFLNPLNAEGVGEMLRADILKRFQDYVTDAPLFFERNILDQHYTYSFLRGVQEAIRGNKVSTSGIVWDNLVALCDTIVSSGEKEQYNSQKRERESFDVWLSSWTGVLSALTDVLQELLSDDSGKPRIDFPKYRDQLFTIIRYLLSYSDPVPEDERLETAKMTTTAGGSTEKYVTDPYSMAINTVRGRAFQAFVQFVYQDGKKFSKDVKSKLSPDVKKLYEIVLAKENTRALMFMFGHYIPSFHARDREWILALLPQIFSETPEKRHLYTAAWEGYLSASLFRELFAEPKIQKLYEAGITLSDATELKQKHFRDPDESIATHLALAFMHYKDFGFEHPLFKAFWSKGDREQHSAFVSFLGRRYVVGENAEANTLLAENAWSKERLMLFWDWMLANYKAPEPFLEFGFWVNTERKQLFDMTWLAERVRKTLEKTRGNIDWDYGYMRSVVALAKSAPKETLTALELYLLVGGVRGTSERRQPFHVDAECFEAFEILYANPETKDGVYKLIDDLIREGGSAFWKLKEVLK
jgi:hypothetical protein